MEEFVAGQGLRSLIWSDNGTNFFASEKELLNIILNGNQQVLVETLLKTCIKWKFNPPSAPYHESVWERLVRNLKHVFYAIIGYRRLIDENLTTFGFVERLYASPLVPPSTGSSLPSTLSSDFDHRKRYARAQAHSDAIWSRWLREYVPTLNFRSKWSSSADRKLKTGDLVWLVEATSPRGYYPLAVVKINYGSDAIARSAEVGTMRET